MLIEIVNVALYIYYFETNICFFFFLLIFDIKKTV